MDSLRERLAHYRQIKLSVTGRKTGKRISVPVWFVAEGEKIYLLPVHGSETQWYQNVLRNPAIEIDARGIAGGFKAQPITEPRAVRSVVEKFRDKYGAGDVKRYYSKFDVAMEVSLP